MANGSRRIDPVTRHRVMASIKKTDTTPELVVRRALHSAGYRYKLHRKDLPGTPDVVFASRKKVVFVHGCFWHQHARCTLARRPKRNLDYRAPKLARNAERDTRNVEELTQTGWRVLTVWECETQEPVSLLGKLKTFLDEEMQHHR
jgi:DNA mismatch endonuclease (patch repair protein)